MEQQPNYQQLLDEIKELRWQLEEANDAIDAIRTGQVDALIVKNNDGPQLYTLKSADQTYRVFIEKMNEGAVTLNQAGIITYSNSKFTELLGLPFEKVLGYHLNDFVHGDKAIIANVIKTSWDKDCKAEVDIAGKNGVIPCLLSCNAMEFDGGLALSIIVTDLTVLKENQKQLELQFDQLEEAQLLTQKLNDELEETVKERTKDLTISREYLKLLTDNIPQMTWTNLPTGEVTFYNQRWYNYTGLSHHETKEWGWQDVVHPDDLPLVMERYLAALAIGGIFEVENRYKKHDGTYRWHLNRAIPLKNEFGENLFWVGTATDIEEQKQAMDKKDEFIGIASHELKTPLTSLKGYIQIMGIYKKEEVPPAIKQYINKASIAVNKLQHLINDLLDVSKIQAGRLSYQMKDADLTEMVNAGIENAIQMYPDYQVEYQVEPQLLVHGNPERLEQVLNNLVSNAAKYSKQHTKITIKAQALDGHVRVSVTDEGIGLSDEQREKIFERFYRVEDKTFTTSGLGMGLYISAEIIQQHNGRIDVESELGKGSTFYFELPRLK
ncbi:PAS domain-containing sensor histidine kinase [Mucilaginibacter myungsuensis]|uniref:histidine kinase n=1 Tax=Mucilaginibacter myungsuensis TaxID=649104 RepID=A0A929KW15_9SPHI|nr:ATP-binding protein [Mucilaginibacter myungsuensis]MBE9662202.1 PAS domain S-box protein [Mucilaginibacter myungsuensis]MDN3599364.1 ATP-binding protein [Mucilaginibacter myungsuensis]